MLIGPAHTHRYRRFADALTGAHARLAEKRGWLVLRFSGLSPPILCQLAWRTVPFSLQTDTDIERRLPDELCNPPRESAL